MARPRKWNSEAERVAAYRERKAQETDETLPSVDVNEPEAETTPTGPPVLSSLPDLEAYVSDALYMAELHHSQASPNATGSTKELAGALERAESYARWRYAGVLAGEVNGL